MTIKLDDAGRDELVVLLAEHKRLAWALTKLDDPKWATTVALTNEEPEEGEDPFVDFEFGTEIIRDFLVARFNSVVDALRLKGIVVQPERSSE